MKTVTILLLTLFISPCTIHAYDKDEGIHVVEKLNFSQPDTTNKQELLEKVRQTGSLRIWIHYKMEHTREGLLSEFERQQQRFEIADKHSQFMALIQGQNIRSINKMKSSPRAAMFVDEEALKFLFELPMLEKITEVKRLRIHTNSTP